MAPPSTNWVVLPLGHNDWDFSEEIPEKKGHPEHLQNSLPLSTAGDGSLSEVVPERASQSWPWNSQQH